MNRRCWICALLLVIVAAALGAGALGEEIIARFPAITGEALPDVLPDAETLRDGYAEQVLSGSGGVARYAYSNRSKLTEAERIVYDEVKLGVNEIANGQRSSSRITIPLGKMNLQTVWYLDAQDGTFIDEQGKIDWDAVADAFWEQIADQLGDQLDMTKAVRALMLDDPYGFYWLDTKKNYGYASPWHAGMDMSYDYESGRYTAVITGNPFYQFPVDALYLDESCDPKAPYTADTGKTGAAQKAVANAEAILNQAAGLSDMERMTLYMQRIRALSEYNYDAAAGNASNSSPWQMIWVFDGDPATKVVCEGYSKAFRYLCDRTDFDDPNVGVCNVTGTMDGGAHMWNIVQYGGENYLVDVTNCVTDGSNPDSLFFSTPISGDVENGYLMRVQWPGGGVSEIRYVYGAETTGIYTQDELTLSTSGQKSFIQWGNVGGLLWMLHEGGRLTVSGEGALDASAFAGWSDVASLVIQEGVTGIGAGAFLDCEQLGEVCLPTSIGTIGDSAFAGCDALAEVVYAGSRAEAQDIAIGSGNDALTNAQWQYLGSPSIDLDEYQVLYLPQDLESVEAEAFVGVTAEVVVLPKGAIRIGSRAFAECGSLLYVIVPEGAELLAAEDAFEGSDVTLIYP